MRVADGAVLLIAVALVWSFYRAQKDPANSINLFDLVMDKGRINRISVAFMVTLCATTWIMVRLTLDGKLTEGYFTGFGLMWVAPLVAKLFSAPPTPGTVTTEDTSKTVTTVDAKSESKS